MLTAHANTTSEDFIAQLRTHVIAFGCSQMVVDCVDNLVGIDDAEDRHAADLRDCESGAETVKEMKGCVLAVVDEWLDEHSDFSEEKRKSLLNAIETAY